MADIDPGCPRPPGRVHNTYWAYRRGCRCPQAHEANLDHSRRWRRTPGGQASNRRKLQREWAARRYIDQHAVDLACSGRRVRLTRWERYAAIDRMTAAGRSARQIGELLGCTARTVVRRRNARRREVACGLD